LYRSACAAAPRVDCRNRLFRIERRLSQHFFKQLTHGGFALSSSATIYAKDVIRASAKRPVFRHGQVSSLRSSSLLPASRAAPLEAGFRSPESLVRNVYAYYGNGSAGLSPARLPHDPETARQFFDEPLQNSWASSRPPYDFSVQSTSWKTRRPYSIAVARRQFDKNLCRGRLQQQRPRHSLNFIVVKGPDGWVIIDVESPYDFAAFVHGSIPQLSSSREDAILMSE